jgi:hypothetical protein
MSFLNELIILAIRRKRAERSTAGEILYEMDFFFAGLVAIIEV